MNRDLMRVSWLNIGVALALLLALSARFINLGELPLGDHEAVQALAATHFTADPAPGWTADEYQTTASPMYVWVTGLIFQFAGSGELQARILPAIAGTLLALLPLFFIDRLPKLELLLASAFLALSPVTVNLSRSARGSSMSALFLAAALCIAFVPAKLENKDRKYIWSNILLGAGLATGTDIFPGLFSLLITFLLIRWLLPTFIRSEAAVEAIKSFLRYLWITPIVALVLASGLGSFRMGVSGMGEALIAWLQGWIPFGQLSALGYLMAGLAYEPFLLIMGVIGAILAWRTGEEWGKALSLWALGALIAALIYPGRSAQDWIWSVIPLGFLAAGVVTALLQRLLKRELWLHVSALVAIALVLISAALVTLLGYVNGYLQQMLIGDPIMIWLALLAMIFLLISVFVLFGLGWSWDIVRDGAGIVVVVVALTASISAAWKLAGDRELGFGTLWVQSMPSENGRYFQSTIENASLALTGDARSAPILVQGDLEPSVVWRLRSYPRFVPSDEQSANSPPILIASEAAGLGALGAEYFGQSFALTLERAWFGLLPPDFLRWSLTGSAPTASTGWVVYIRADVVSLTDISEGAISD